MRLLLDTHVWLWLLEQPDELANDVLVQLEAADELVLSAASIWEIAIKVQLGKLRTNLKPTELRLEILRELAAKELNITPEHALVAAALPVVHRDPFDRMLVAQAQLEGLTLVTADAQVRLYGGDQLWVGR